MMTENNCNPKQCERLKNYLAEHGKITQLEALKRLGIMRLSSRMSELKKKEHYKFNRRMITVKNQFDEQCRVAEYFIEN